jgi:exosortase A-associated hydrolase 1
MGECMRRILSFDCEGSALAATLDDAPGTTGLLIVSGGNEIRAGAHRGMAMLAAEIASAGYPVFRFDRRGIGDSEGENGEFTASAADLSAAVAAFRAACPHVTRIVAFGNCDAASAIVLHRPAGLSAAVLANIWVIERADDMPPPAAIKARYIERMKDPKAWVGLFTGAINVRKLVGGLFRLAKPATPSSLPQSVADGIAAFGGPIDILLAERDATAIAFISEWTKPTFAAAKARADVSVQKLDSASHSFASASDHGVLVETLLAALA